MERGNRETIPISALKALEYCPRKFYYQFVQGEEEDDEWVLEEVLTQQRLSREAEKPSKRLYLHSETRRLNGTVEVIEERNGVLIPVEYKREGQGIWPNDQIQLCAQALCLEERQREATVAAGIIIYRDSRRRAPVPFTPQVRASTKAAIAQALEISGLQIPPPPLSGHMISRCKKCSYRTICLPEEVRMLIHQSSS